MVKKTKKRVKLEQEEHRGLNMNLCLCIIHSVYGFEDIYGEFGIGQYLFVKVIINSEYHTLKFLPSSLFSGLIFIVNKFDNKYRKARMLSTTLK